MVRLLMLLLFMALVFTGSLAVKSCSQQTDASSRPSKVDDSALVALRDGSTLVAVRGTVSRELVDWFAAGNKSAKSFELGGQEFIGHSATPSSESIGRVSRLITMLDANSDVHLTIIGHAAASGNIAADHKLGLARAQTLAKLLSDGGISEDRITVFSKGSTEPIAPNDTPQHRAHNERVSLVLSRES